MTDAIFVFIIIGFVTFGIINHFASRHTYCNRTHLFFLFIYHYLLWAAYFVYAAFNPSDSHQYYYVAHSGFRGDFWLDYYGTGTQFIEFLTYALVNSLGLSYTACMILFAFLGYMGFVYLYLFLKETIVFKHKILGFDLILILLFLPNAHFWSVSMGKGSVVFLGLGLFFYGLSKFNSRWLAIFLGGLIIYYVRPHVMFIILIAGIIGFVSTSRRVTIGQRLLFISAGLIIFLSIQEDVLKMTGLQENLLEESTLLSHRAEELTKATSGVEIGSYNIPMKLFTFWFRPLFVDAPGLLGLIISIENLVYLILIFKLVRYDFINYLWNTDFLAKTAILTFLGVSFPLAQLSGNLGLALRQKSMVMLLFFFVVLYYVDAKKFQKYKLFLRRKVLSSSVKSNQSA